MPHLLSKAVAYQRLGTGWLKSYEFPLEQFGQGQCIKQKIAYIYNTNLFVFQMHSNLHRSAFPILSNALLCKDVVKMLTPTNIDE